MRTWRWKDAGDSMTYPDGTPVRGPKALCELQGYVYDAWVRMAEVFDALGRRTGAAELRRKAAALFDKFNEAFWDEDSGFYAYMLDGEKTQGHDRRLQSRASAVVRHRSGGPGGAGGGAADGAGHELRLGHPHAVERASGV